jgi:hypothetical protein
VTGANGNGAAGTMFPARRFLNMAEFRFDLPIMLQSNVAVSSFGEAAAFVRSFHGAQRPLAQQSVLRRLEGPRTLEERRTAADTFGGWARIEGLLQKP